MERKCQVSESCQEPGKDMMGVSWGFLFVLCTPELGLKNWWPWKATCGVKMS